MSAVETAIRLFLEQHDIGPCHLLVAVSGGPDSTALLVALLGLRDEGYTVTAGHVNHHLRGEASDLDQEFVRRICEAHQVPLEVTDGALDPQRIRERGVEAAAREVRYRELEKLRQRAGARFTLTAHHRDDQAETLLMRLITGSGVERLAGIAPVSGPILRPLLEVGRADLSELLRERGMEGRLDSSNADFRFLRNRIRLELIPLLSQYNPRIVENLAALALQVRDRSRVFELLLGDALTQWVRRTPSGSDIDLAALPPDPWLRRAVLWREIRRLDPDAREISSADLKRLAQALPTLRRTSVSKTLEITRNADKVTLRVLPRQSAPLTRNLKPGTEVRLDGRLIRLERRGAATPPYTDSDRSFQMFQLPPDAPGDSFVVRTRRRGERFQPLGLDREKKLNEFLIDRKIPRELRDQIPLLTWQDEIVWIAGVEVSEKFKVAEPWRDVYTISIEGAESPPEIHH